MKFFPLDVTKMERPARSGLMAVIIILNAMYYISTWPPGDCDNFPACLLPNLSTVVQQRPVIQEQQVTHLITPLSFGNGHGKGKRDKDCPCALEVRSTEMSVIHRFPMHQPACSLFLSEGWVVNKIPGEVVWVVSFNDGVYTKDAHIPLEAGGGYRFVANDQGCQGNKDTISPYIEIGRTAIDFGYAEVKK